MLTNRVPFTAPPRIALGFYHRRNLVGRVGTKLPPTAGLLFNGDLCAPVEWPEIKPTAKPARQTVDEVSRDHQNNDAKDDKEDHAPKRFTALAGGIERELLQRSAQHLAPRFFRNAVVI